MDSVIKRRHHAGSTRPSRTMMVAMPIERRADEADVEPTPEEIAAEIIARAERQAAEIVASAHSEADRLKTEAHAEGVRRGVDEAEAHWQERMAALDEQAEALHADYGEMFRAAEPDLAQLAVDIARKIMKQELSVNAEAVLPVVRAAIHRVKDRGVRVLVNPKDCEVTRGDRETLTNIVDGADEIEIVSDRRVGQGGCIIETPSANIDARLETQLARIGDVIDEACNDQRNAARRA